MVKQRVYTHKPFCLQDPVCTPDQYECYKNIQVDDTRCLKSCEGTVIRKEFIVYHILILKIFFNFSYASKPMHPSVVELQNKLTADYNEYKGRNKFLTNVIESNRKLKYVRIYFDTPTFDRITKDRAAKPVDMLSAIGGTMGLLTGFSLISGVEIIYFACKIFINILIKKCKKLV